MTESQFAILQAASCEPGTEALSPLDKHHDLVQGAERLIVSEDRSVGGHLGSSRGARFRTYERLMQYAKEVEGTLFNTRSLKQAIESIYQSPLRSSATHTLNRLLRTGISNEDLAMLAINLWEIGQLCIVDENQETQEVQIICSLGLRANREENTDAN